MLEFMVRDKRITRRDSYTLVAGAENHYAMRVEFDADWDGLTKTVLLENGETCTELLYTGGVTLPVLQAGELAVSVRGTKTLKDGRTQIVRTARMLRPSAVLPCGAEHGGMAEEVSPSLTEQILAILGDPAALETAEKTSIVAAVNAIFRESGIERIAFKRTDEAGGNVYTVTLSRGEQYDFTAPRGMRGEKGEKGDAGEKGDTGRGFQIFATYPTVAALEQAVQNAEPGDAYAVGVEEPYDVYLWDGVRECWVNHGALKGVKGDQGIQGEKGEKGDKGEKGEKGDTGAPGAQGEAGRTPVKGTDYFTAADRSEIAAAAAKLVAVPQASTTAPKAAGAATAGSESTFARGDHVHPQDGTKIDNPAEKADGQVLTYDAASGTWKAKKADGGQIYVTEYSGTGTFGSANPNTLTFDFVPLIVFIMPKLTINRSYTVATFMPGLQRVNWLQNLNGEYYFARAKVTWSEDLKTMSWFAEAAFKLAYSATQVSQVFFTHSMNSSTGPLLQLNSSDEETGAIPYRVIALRSE